MAEIDVDLLFERNHQDIYDEIFMSLNQKDCIIIELAENCEQLQYSLSVIADFILELKNYLEIQYLECDKDKSQLQEALIVACGISKSELHNMSIFLEDARDLTTNEILNLDICTLLSYNLNIDYLENAFESIGIGNHSYIAVANPIIYFNGQEFYEYGNNFFIEKTDQPASQSQYLLVVESIKQYSFSEVYSNLFEVISSYELNNLSSQGTEPGDYDLFSTVLSKEDELKFTDMLIVSNKKVLNVKVGQLFGKLIDTCAYRRVNLLEEGDKYYLALPYVFEGDLINETQVENIALFNDCNTNYLDDRIPLLELPDCIEYKESLQDNEFGGLALTAKMQLSSNAPEAKIEDGECERSYFYVYMANEKYYAAKAGKLASPGRTVKVKYLNGNIAVQGYHECRYSLSFDLFLQAYTQLQTTSAEEQTEIAALLDNSEYNVEILRVFEYAFCDEVQVLDCKIISKEEDEEDLVFTPELQENVPDLVFFQTNETIFNSSINQWSISQSSYSKKSFKGSATQNFDSYGSYSMQNQAFTFQMSPVKQPRSKVQLSIQSFTQDNELSSIQAMQQIDTKAFMIRDVTGYVRYHFPSYGIAIVAFVDPYHRDDQWIHSVAVWKIPDELLVTVTRQKNQVVTKGKEEIYFARSKIICDVYPMDANSGIYLVERAKFIDYVDPATLCSNNQVVEGSVYWQEIDKEKKQDNTFGFVRLPSGHERHFFCKKKVSLLGHLVQISLQENKQHPNSCELIKSLQSPPDKQKWLLGRVLCVYQQVPPFLENILKKSFRTTMTHAGPGRQLINGMVMAEPFEGTHVDICFFRTVQPEFIINQLKTGVAVYFTLKEQALHKVIDEAKYEIPIDMLNDINSGSALREAYKIYSKEQGNSAKLSCWAIDNISIANEFYLGDFISLRDKNCQGIKPEALFFDRYKQLLQQQRDSFIYVPRPLLQYNEREQVLQEQERLRFNVYFAYNDLKSAFLPEASQICRVQQNVCTQGVKGRIIQLKDQRQFLYIFKPDSCDSLVDYLRQCISDVIVPLNNCFLIKSSCFYLLENEIICQLNQKGEQNKIRTVFQQLISGNIEVILKTVSLGLLSTSGFDDAQRFREIEWCRYVDELVIKKNGLDQIKNEEDIQIETDDFLKY